MVILDSNIWVAFFDEYDSTHQKAVNIFASMTEKVLITEYIILEAVTIISQKKNKGVANKFLEKISVSENIKVHSSSQEFLDEVVNFYLEKSNRSLSFVDYSLLFLSQKIQIITFDKKLKKEIEKLN